MKFFCPWCDLELTSNKPRAGHVNEHEAWGRFECEYQVGDKSRFNPNKNCKPISKKQRDIETLESLIRQRKSINKSIRELRKELGIK